MSTTTFATRDLPAEQGGADATMNDPLAQESVRDLTASELAKLRAGNAEAATLLDSLYREPLQRFLWGYLGSMDAAEDAYQDICHNVLRAKTVPERFRPWIYKIARNHCYNLLRDDARRKDHVALPSASALDAALTGHLTHLVNNEDLARLRAMVESLPPTHREVLRLRHVEGLPPAEIADVLDVPVSVVKSRVFEAMKKLREHAGRPDGPALE